jgi:hypothetical protein
VADEARKQVLAEALTTHFQQLSRFAQGGLKLKLDASALEPRKRRQLRPQGPIATDGILGLPITGTPSYMAQEWLRMYHLPPMEEHLLAALREHTKDAPAWVHWDRWRKKVADYEKASMAVWSGLEVKMEDEPPENTGPGEVDSCKNWLFGNILLAAGGGLPAGPETMGNTTDDNVGIMAVAYGGESVMPSYLHGLIKEIKQQPGWTQLETATANLRVHESQTELRQIARKLDYALVGIEMMPAFPGRCNLCPA